MKKHFQFLFTLNSRVNGAQYFKAGFSLMGFKYVIDTLLIKYVTGAWWTPWDYLNPFWYNRTSGIEEFPNWLSLILLIWALPFIWIGVSIMMRRLVDAGKSPWLSLLFFVPPLNYICMILFGFFPSSDSIEWDESPISTSVKSQFKSAVLGILISCGISLLGFTIGVYGFQNYGVSLFIITPFLLGVACAYTFNLKHSRTLASTLGVVTLSLFILGGVFILFALEGIICIAMAYPIGWAISSIGAIFGRAIATRSSVSYAGLACMILLVPASDTVESYTESAPETFEIVSEITIDASPQKVWKHLIGFNKIEESPKWYFRAGIAYPIEAKIVGTGVGAVRHCIFSTGAFVEPITRWEEPTRLSFDVQAQPDPLQEWSPYGNIATPHLEHFFKTTKGEFRLISLPNGKTLLEGSTWYQNDMQPMAYWRFFAEQIISDIHDRVFIQIKNDAEK